MRTGQRKTSRTCTCFQTTADSNDLNANDTVTLSKNVKDVKVFPMISESGNSCTLLLGGGGSVDSKALDFAEYTRIAMSCAGMLSAKSKGSLRPEANATVCACGGHGLSRFEHIKVI